MDRKPCRSPTGPTCCTKAASSNQDCPRILQETRPSGGFTWDRILLSGEKYSTTYEPGQQRHFLDHEKADQSDRAIHAIPVRGSGSLVKQFAKHGSGYRMGEEIRLRSEERRVGKECVSKCKSGWSADQKKKKKT